ncbi:MAG: formylglycine-generating enzyme family protein [Proteobacteria bacterium]|nr:formylglycine-generating enzyme family protein [Pseudomonadota bacterium]
MTLLRQQIVVKELSKEGATTVLRMATREVLERGGLKTPEMVEIPAGMFRMGEFQGGGNDQRSLHMVRIATPFAMGKYEVTFEAYDQFAVATGRELPDDRGWGRGKRPVMRVSWNDAVAYARWLSEQTGKRYRLPTEAEWEYAARAGSTTRYWWGNDIGRNNANCIGCGSRWDNKQTAPVGSFRPNDFGLYDTAGNVWEWVEDCWNKSYDGAPSDGSAWLGGDCSNRVLRGGSWVFIPWGLRSAYRFRGWTVNRYVDFGFRVARTLP